MINPPQCFADRSRAQSCSCFASGTSFPARDAKPQERSSLRLSSATLNVVYPILAIHSHEQIEAVGEDDVHHIVLGKNLVGPGTAAELIVPGTADECVIAGTPFQVVVAAATVQQVTEQT